MRSPVSRVAAAVVFLLALTGVALWLHGLGATFVIADFVAPLLEARGVKYTLTAEMKGPPPITTTSEVMVLDDARMRQETAMPDGSKMVMIQDMTQGKSLYLLSSSKSATILAFTNRPKYKSAEGGNPLAGYRSLLLDARDNPSITREPLGEKVIDGRRVIGFHISSQRGVMDLWGDPRTGLPVRVEITLGMDGNTKATMSHFEFNVDMDKSLFSLEPPAGYTVRRETLDGSPHGEKDLIEMFREYAKLNRGVFPKSLDVRLVSFMVWKKLNFQGLWDNLNFTVGKGNGKALEEQRNKLEEQWDEFADKMYDHAMNGKVNKEANQEPMQKFQEQMSQLVLPMAIQKAWEGLALDKLKGNEEQRREFEKRMRKIMEGKPNGSQARQFGEETMKFVYQMLWEDFAPAKSKANEELRHKFEELMLKMEMNPNEKQKVKDEFRARLGNQMLNDVEAWEAQMEKAKKAQMEAAEAQTREAAEESRKFMEAQQRVQRGVMFANQLPPAADAHYVGNGVLLGAANTPIFWYRPTVSKKYRVIYADLSVRDADTPPNVPKAQPVPAPSSPKK